MTTFRDYGYFPPQDEWPGGHRYGLTVTRDVVNATWSAADQELADQHDIKLPRIVERTVSAWWDQPKLLTYQLTETVGLTTWRDRSDWPAHSARPRTTATYARQWAIVEVNPDPLRNLRTRSHHTPAP